VWAWRPGRSRRRGVGQSGRYRACRADVDCRRRAHLPVIAAVVNAALDRGRVPQPSGEAAAFHAALPGYAPTPLHELPAVAAELGLGAVLIKDESDRLGLPAFKILGASWA